MTNALEQRIAFLKRLRENARTNNLDSAYQYLHGVIAGIEIATEEWEKTKAPEPETDRQLIDDLLTYGVSLYKSLSLAKTPRDANEIIGNSMEEFMSSHQMTAAERDSFIQGNLAHIARYNK